MVSYLWRGDRLKQFFKKRDISITDAAEKLGVSRQTVYQYFASERLTREVVEKILQTFKVKESEIFEAELVHHENFDEFSEPTEKYGKGINQFIDLKNGNVLMITPLVEEYAQAGFLSGYNDQSFIEDLPSHSIVTDKFHKGNYYSFRVNGSSMDDGTSQSIVQGSIVTCREIKRELWQSRFHIHRFKDYVIVHEEGILVKRISAHNVETGVITLNSLNPNKDCFPDIEISLDECKMILNIVNVSVAR